MNFQFPTLPMPPQDLQTAVNALAQRRALNLPTLPAPMAAERLAEGQPTGGFWNSAGAPLPSLAAPPPPQTMMAYADPGPMPSLAAPPPPGPRPMAEPSPMPSLPTPPAQQDWWSGGGRQFLGDALTDLGAGLASGRDWQEGLGIATERMAQMGPQRQQMRQAGQERNSTIEYLRANAPDLAEAVAAGLPVTAAWQEALRRQQRAMQGPDLTANQRDFMFAQENPGFAEFIGGDLPANVQEYEYARSQGFEGSLQDWLQTRRPSPAMNATIQKEIFEADESVLAGQSVMQALDRALELNNSAWDGPLAEQRAYGGALFGNQDGVNTLELKNLITTQALDQLRAIFGGMPTEGERKILLEIQGSVDQPREVRKRIYERAKAAADRRIKSNAQKAQALRSGTYFDEGYGQQQPAAQSGGWSVVGVE